MDNYEYKKKYSTIFVFYYLIEGFSQGIPFLIFPPYLAQVLGNQYDIAQWLIIYAIGTIPWAIKMIIGIANDKWGSKKYGRRFPWIVGFGIYGGIFWILMGLFLPTDESIYGYMAFYYFMTALGTAFSDSALDGLILDVTPKERLAKLQGLTWSCLLLGMGAGGILLGLIFLALNITPYLFIITGVLMIISCFLTYIVNEPPLKEVTTRNLAKDVISVFTKKKNYKVFGYVFFGAIPAMILVTFFNYLILISIGIIEVKETILTIQAGDAVDLLGWTSLFYVLSGFGTIIGSIVAGKFADKNRKKTLSLAYIIYTPFCVLSVIPFLITGHYLIALLYGLIAQILFGAVQGALVIVSSAINGDITRKEYPDLKSTYYALTISAWNGGQTVGQLIGAFLFAVFALYFMDFNILYSIIAVYSAGALLGSFLIFRSINPEMYEFEHLIGEKKEVYFA
ncbi:MAG: MFS transporter [Candidatus Hermodarchaeota archaeon]